MFFTENYFAHLDKVATEFNQRFELDVMECVAALVSNPFMPIDEEDVASKFQQVFDLSSGVDMEIVDLQNYIVLKARSRDSDFWGLVNWEKFPLLTTCALKVSAYFGST